ncbi:MAG: sulfite exporter TauE/SafE family protein [Acidimicrobiales bacterium]|nr:sulfite exporter TauE/SafE family protein [Acidimicrobiales bacterium]
MNLVALAGLAALTGGVGALGGLGGAVLLVPLLVLSGTPVSEAAPLGMLSVAAGALAAGAPQLREGTVHHRLGVTVEVAASAGTFAGALASGAISSTVLARLLAVVALGSALSGFLRKGIRNLPDDTFAGELPGEWPGSLGGTYRLGDDTVPYQARRLALGLPAMVGAGIVSGLSGVGGGFLKTPVMSEIMRVPVKVAAATTTFTVGVTAAAGLIVYTTQGRIDTESGAAVVLGGLLGGTIGARLQGVLRPTAVRKVLSAVLVVVAGILLVRG